MAKEKEKESQERMYIYIYVITVQVGIFCQLVQTTMCLLCILYICMYIRWTDLSEDFSEDAEEKRYIAFNVGL